jgi:hypothetical protein
MVSEAKRPPANRSAESRMECRGHVDPCACAFDSWHDVASNRSCLKLSFFSILFQIQIDQIELISSTQLNTLSSTPGHFLILGTSRSSHRCLSMFFCARSRDQGLNTVPNGWISRCPVMNWRDVKETSESQMASLSTIEGNIL